MKMQVTVYFIHEPTGYMMPVAMFSSEDLYMDCLSALKKSAESAGCVVGETINYIETEGE